MEILKKVYLISLVAVIVDQITKNWLLKAIGLGNKVAFSFFDINMITNTGISFGMLTQFPWIITILALIIVGYIINYIHKNKLVHWSQWLGCSLVIGGAVGNLIDRFRFGYVVDFLDFRWWPAFNVADACICVGAVFLVWYFWKIEK